MKRRLLCLTLAGCLACCHREGASDEGAAADSALVTAATAVASLQEFPQLVRAIGTVTPRPGRFAALAAPAPTRVARIFVAAGQRVAGGDSLIEVDRAPFDSPALSSHAALTSARPAYAPPAPLLHAPLPPRQTP